MARLRSFVRFIGYDVKFAGLHLLRNVIAGSPFVTRGLRIAIYNLAGVKAGLANVYPGVRFLNVGNVVIAEDAMLNSGVIIDSYAPVTIGRGVHVGPEVLLGTSTHHIGQGDRRAGEVYGAPITIHAGAWIGARAVILPGVTIGAGAVVAAGAVVTKDCEPHTLYAGVPARVVRPLDAASA